MHEHILTGCRPKPLASYLKAIGILRLLSEQKDSKAKGWWRGESFAIKTGLGNDELESFFCEEYAPTPIVAPWNGGSGFYLGHPVDGIEAILSSQSERFGKYRETISQIKSWSEMPTFETLGDVCAMLCDTLEGTRAGKARNEIVGHLADIEENTPASDILGDQKPSMMSLKEIERFAGEKGSPSQGAFRTWWKIIKKARTKCNGIRRSKNKSAIMRRCRSRLSEQSLEWFDAVYALKGDGGASYNSLLGSGGSDGNLEFSNTFMQRVAELFINGNPEKRRRLFQSSVFSETRPGLIAAKVGMYDPGRAGGYNQGMEIETKDFKINPWDFILALEGSLSLAGAMVRRSPTDNRSKFTAPFTVVFSPVGFSSSARDETGSFYETWLPIWKNPATYGEIRHLFGEGRSCVGRRISHTGIDFSRAVGTLGVDRGIEAFERYAFLQRRGDSYVALPSGRIGVRYSPSLEILNELDPITSRIDQFLRSFKPVPPASFRTERRRIDQRIFACYQRPDPHNFGGLVRAIGRLERLIALRDRSANPKLDRPLLGLSPQWIKYCDDKSAEVRIAAALSSIRGSGKVGPLRTNMAGVSPSAPWQWSKSGLERCWFGSTLGERLGKVLSRRLMDAERKSEPDVPLWGWLPISPHDVMPFLSGGCDNEKLEELLWGFTLIDWRKRGVKEVRSRWGLPLTEHPVSRTWCVLKLLNCPGKIRDVEIRREKRICNFLMAGRVSDACRAAIHRLRVSELHPYDVSFEEELDSTRLLASLMIPVRDQWKLESLVLKKISSNL